MNAFSITMLFLLPIVLLVIAVYISIKNGKQKTDYSEIKKQFNDMCVSVNEMHNSRNNIDHCPKCGSHNIKIYREGYDYNKGFWLRMFDVKGGGYVAGMNSNRARCHCMDCGQDWATNYDYRLIDK